VVTVSGVLDLVVPLLERDLFDQEVSFEADEGPAGDENGTRASAEPPRPGPR
jgi:hypothetical protein